jgi:hypothetical protein
MPAAVMCGAMYVMVSQHLLHPLFIVLRQRLRNTVSLLATVRLGEERGEGDDRKGSVTFVM